MSRVYADSSALVRAYLADEPASAVARRLLFDGEGVMTSEVARVEFASAVTRAFRARRIDLAGDYLLAFDADCGVAGPVALLPLRSPVTLHTAHRIASTHGLRGLDAIHVATAIDEAASIPVDDGISFVTFDDEQAAAARAEGLRVI
ncbi:MAG TPA: type II toxin-antitoxin system VapC family toxin [Actinomycetota bacterium]